MQQEKGFTLIEVLVVVSIIALISSVIIAATNVAKAKSRDANKQETIHSTNIALEGYVQDKGSAPTMYDCTSTCVANPTRSTYEIEDVSNPTNPQTESGKAYNATMQNLVSGGYLSQIPHAPSGSPTGYFYYDTGPHTTAGALFGATMETGTAAPISCTPFNAINGDLIEFNDPFTGVLVDIYAINFDGGPAQNKVCGVWQVNPNDGSYNPYGDSVWNRYANDGSCTNTPPSEPKSYSVVAANFHYIHQYCTSGGSSTDYCACAAY